MNKLTQAEKDFFAQEQALHEAKSLAGTNPRQQSGFGRDVLDWERFRRPVVAPIDRDGSFLDIGCANGLLMESIVAWAREDGHRVEPFGLDISGKLAELARHRLPRWRDRIFVGNALLWQAPARFDFVRTELVYVPPQRRREYAQRLLAVRRTGRAADHLFVRQLEARGHARRAPGRRDPGLGASGQPHRRRGQPRSPCSRRCPGLV